jgi:hypothetical protein
MGARGDTILFAVAFSLLLLSASSFSAVASSLPGQQFSSSLMPYNTGAVPQGYLFGTGTWSGWVGAGFKQMNFTVAIEGAMPYTTYIVTVAFYNSSGGALARSYGLVKTNGQGNGLYASKSNIFEGTVEITLWLSDKTNFAPPLTVLTADPLIGSDVPT